MCITDYPRDTWILHRRLVHRFLKYKHLFIAAGENVADYIRRLGQQEQPAPRVTSRRKAVISLLSDDSDDTDSDDGDGAQKDGGDADNDDGGDGSGKCTASA